MSALFSARVVAAHASPPGSPPQPVVASPPAPTLASPAPVAAAVAPIGPPSAKQVRAAKAAALGLLAGSDGSYRYARSNSERFDAVIKRDGSVRFELDSVFRIELESLCLVALCLAKNGNAPARRKRAGESSYLSQLATQVGVDLLVHALGGENSDARLSGRYQLQSSPQRQHLGIASNPLGIGGRYGYLPNPNAQLLSFMDRTFEFRLELAQEAAVSRMELAILQLPARLNEVWFDARISVEQRKSALLEIWDELDFRSIDEPLHVAMTSTVDDKFAEATRRARSLILDFVRIHLPPGSAVAFTPAQLAAYNQLRELRSRFEPYSK